MLIHNLKAERIDETAFNSTDKCYRLVMQLTIDRELAG